MTHNKSIYQLPGFWAALFIPLAVSGAVASWIAWHSLTKGVYSVCVSAECINGALVMMKLPLGIMALVFPSVALVASHHRSVQTVAQINRTDDQIARTDKQIEATDQKNAFENCIKHRELFEKFIEEAESSYPLKVHDRDSLYRYIFPLNIFTIFSPVTSEFENKNGQVLLLKEAYIDDLYVFFKKHHLINLSQK